MAEERKQIFREQSLDKLSSPDRLDQLLRVVRPRAWVSLTTLGVGIAIAVVWSVVGRIPSTVDGSGILVRPKQVVPFQTPASGQLASISASVGTIIRKGELLATLHLPKLEERLKLEQIKLEEFSDRTAQMTLLERSLATSERDHLQLERTLIQERIGTIKIAAERFRGKSEQFISMQRASVAIGKETAAQLGQALSERLAARTELLELETPLIGADSVLEVRERVIANQLYVADLDTREHELELRANTARETFDRQMDQINGLELDLHALALRDVVITSKLEEDELRSDSERQEIARTILELSTQFQHESRIIADHDGKVLEITASIGEQLAMGERLGKIEIDDPSAKLMVLAYFTVRDGKRLASPGEDLRFRITPATVERERFGSIEGRIVRVSDYPVTTAAAAHQIGDLETARTLLGGESRIEVLAELSIGETPTGYLWTSGSGPVDAAITAGTTAQVRVTVEKLAPITLILPFLGNPSDP